ncbi:MAG: TlpA family protein disulfide reductase [Polyangiaceae bacterium]|nr:TlpA family protein disulfide reductase [Polyangiaceae bacterium]
MPPIARPRALLTALLLGACSGGSSTGSSNMTSSPVTASPASAPAHRLAIGPNAAETDVSSIVGKPAPGWNLTTWLNGPPRRLADLRGQVVLVRWFMSSECPYCNATAPALVKLDDTYAARGLTIVGMYHHKSETPLVVADVKKLVDEHYRFRFPVAIDDDWKTLKTWWLDDHPKSWTSVSFLVDRAGTVRYAHLGGEYPVGSDDYAQMQAWIDELLAERRG